MSHPCYFGFWLGTGDDTAALRFDYDPLGASMTDAEAVTLPHPHWSAHLILGTDLYRNWCTDVLADPMPIESVRIRLTGGAFTWVTLPAESGVSVATIDATGLEITTGDGEVVRLGDVTITNRQFGFLPG